MTAAVAYDDLVPEVEGRTDGQGGRKRPSMDSPRLAVQLIGTRPHLTAVPRPGVKTCTTCRRSRLVAMDPAPTDWFAEALDIAVRWNA